MVVDAPENNFTVFFGFAYVSIDNTKWEAVDDVVLSVADWVSLRIATQADGIWTEVPSENPEIFKEILDVQHQPDQLILEGFSAQSGLWLRYDCKGDGLQIAVKTQ